MAASCSWMRFSCAALLAASILMLTGGQARSQTLDSPRQAGISGDLTFVPNRGQIVDANGNQRPDVLFTAGTGGVRLFFTSRGVSYVFARFGGGEETRSSVAGSSGDGTADGNAGVTTYRMDMELIGASLNVPVMPEEKAGEYLNFYYPHCADGITGVPTYQRLLYREVYPNIDLVFYAGKQGMKYDFIVRPGGNPADIKLRYVGADGVELTREGRLRVVNPLGQVVEEAPVTFEKGSTSARAAGLPVKSSYRINDGVVTFAVGKYNASRTLVIDPDLAWATYYGGGDQDVGNGITTDGQDNVIITGATSSLSFPITPGALQTTHGGWQDIVVVKLDKNGVRLWATYYGGNGIDIGKWLATDQNNTIVVTGATASNDFVSTTGPFETNTRNAKSDVAVIRLDASGSRIWATRFGGSEDDHGFSISIDPTGNLAITGWTWSSDYPVSSGAFQSTYGGGAAGFGTGDAFLVKLDASGARQWSTYIGGGYADEGYGVATDRDGNIVVVGKTVSLNFPVSADALQKTRSGSGGDNDGFIGKFDPSGQRLWMTYYGGAGNDFGNGVAINPAGHIYVVGRTFSSNFPVTSGATQGAMRGTTDGFIAKFTPGGSTIWSTFYGGTAAEDGRSIAVCPGGNVLVTGMTSSSDIQVFGRGFQRSFSGDNDAFVVNFSENGEPLWATYYGGSGLDQANSVATDKFGDVVITGSTQSTDFPTEGAIQGSRGGVEDAIIMRFNCCCANNPPIPIMGDREICERGSGVLQAPPGYKAYRWSTGDTTQTIVITQPGDYAFSVFDTLGCRQISEVLTVAQLPAPKPLVTAGGPTRFCRGDSVMLTAPQGYVSYRWSTGSTNESIVVGDTGAYVVTVTDNRGCVGESMPTVVSFIPPPAVPTIDHCSNLLKSNPALTYQWSLDGAPIPGANDRKLTVSKVGIYTVTVTDSNGCASTSTPYALSDVEISTTTVALPVIVAAPGDTLSIPLILVTSNRFPMNDARDFLIRIRTNKGLLMPLDSVENLQIEGGERVYSIRKDRLDGSNTIADLKFIVGLGDAEVTPIHIESFAWGTDCPILVTRLDGELRLKDVCRVGGSSRLFLADGELTLKQSNPNPTTGATEIEYELLEPGYSRLYVADMLGRTVTTLLEGEQSAGKGIVTLDAAQLAPGIYYYILETPTSRVARMMEVTR